jgi:hypothetical protein
VLGGVKMLGCVLIFGGVATADVTARETKAQVNPGIAGLKAFLATVGSRRNLVDLLQMDAGCHRLYPSLISLGHCARLWWSGMIG